MSTPARSWRTRVERAAAATATALVAAASTSSVFDAGFDLVPMFVAAVVAAAVAVALSSTVWPVRAAGGVVSGIVGAAWAASSFGGPVGSTLAAAPRSGIGEILQSTWPSPPTAAGVTAVAAVVAWASFGAVDLAIHRRTASALMPTLAVLLLSALLSAPGGPPSVLLVTVYALAAIWLMLSFRTMGRDVLTWAAAVALVAVAVPVVTAPAWSSARYDPRDLDATQQQRVEDVAPLGRLDEWRSIRPEVPMFRTDLAQPDVWRVVALTRFDGVSWLPADDYRTAAAGIVGDDEGAVGIGVTIDRLDTRWYPMIDRLIGIDVDHEIDGTGGSLLASGELPTGTTYRIDVVPTTVQPAELVGLDASPADSPWTDDFVLPTDIADLASVITAGAVDDVDRAQRLAAHLQNEYVLDPTAPSGHSAALIELFLTRTKRGTDEQFVAAYGMLAASIGLPVRLAVGFAASPDDVGGTVAMSSDARAWPEIEFDDVGWVPFDPIPTSTGTNTADAGTGAVAPVDDASIPPPTTSPPAPDTTEPDETEEPVEVAESGSGVPASVIVGVGGALLVLAAVVGYVVGVLALKRRRRRHRQLVADPATASLGAFATGVDLSVDLGADLSPAATPLELVAASGEANRGAERLLVPLAQQATATVFDPRPVTEDRAVKAWEALEGYERATRASVGVPRWWRAALSRRSLGRRRRW